MYHQFLVTEGDPEREAYNATYLSLLLTLADMSEEKKIGKLHCQGPSERYYVKQRLGSLFQVTLTPQQMQQSDSLEER